MSKQLDDKIIEELVRKIQSVISTKAILDDNKIVELHLLTDNNRNAKQISRDVQSALAAELGIEIDHKVISIAQIEFNEDSFNNKRVKIKGVSKIIESNEFICEVKLSINDKEVVGDSKQKNISSRKDYSFVVATINALEKLYEFDDMIFLEGIEIIEGHKYSVVVVLVSTIFEKEEVMSGSSVIENDRDLALVKATLDAVNRRLNML
ncbi:MAG: hypothetical protein J7L15_02300 [Clostridiales bacterium]|nr:hypothetical protein [Clostridiales bacterium]